MRWLPICAILLLVACAPAIPAKPPLSPLTHPIQRAVAYLQAQYHGKPINLLRESPDARPNKHWLATDNQLAVYALRAAHEETFATQLEQARQGWHPQPHGIIEALVGETIPWPPHQEHQYEVVLGQPPPIDSLPNVCSEPENAPKKVVCQEIRDIVLPTFDDWAYYADLAFYGALEACNRGDGVQANARFERGMNLFKHGRFTDKANAGNQSKYYTTYKLALALYVGVVLGLPTNDTLLAALLAKQDKKTGGFVTLYDSQGIGQGDSNTETTAYALLALAAIQNGGPSQGGDSHCPRP